MLAIAAADYVKKTDTIFNRLTESDWRYAKGSRALR